MILEAQPPMAAVIGFEVAIYLLACTAILSAAGVTPTGWERASNKWTTVGGAAQDSTGVGIAG